MPTIEKLETDILAALATLKATYGATTELTEQSVIDEVSASVDLANETWNTDLPSRPHA